MTEGTNITTGFGSRLYGSPTAFTRDKIALLYAKSIAILDKCALCGILLVNFVEGRMLKKKLAGRTRKKECREAYAASGVMIRARGKAIYGSLTKLSVRIGLSRQALHHRVTSAEVWPLSHGWWATVLCCPVEYVTAGNADFPMPSESEVSTALVVQEDHWEIANAKRGTWNNPVTPTTEEEA